MASPRTGFRLLLCSLLLAHASPVSFAGEGGEGESEYTVADQFDDKEEFSYVELSEPWRRTKRDGVSLVRLPTGDVGRAKGLCGTFHYNPDTLAHTPEEWEAHKKGEGKSAGIHTLQEVGSYVTEIAACRFIDALQAWTEECEVFAEDKNICRIAWGDASHRDKKSSIRIPKSTTASAAASTSGPSRKARLRSSRPRTPMTPSSRFI